MSLLSRLNEIEVAKNNIKTSLENKGKQPGNDIRDYAAIINSLDGDIASPMKVKVIIQELEPENSAYQGFWIKSSTYTYSEIHIITDRKNVVANSINIVKLSKNNKYKTVLVDSDVSGGLYFDFYEVLITDENNEIQWNIPVYYGNDISWVDITSEDAHWAGVTVDYVNKNVTRIAGSYDLTEISCYTNRIRCNINDNGEILAEYGDSNYDNIGSSNVNVMVKQPIVYYSVQNIVLNDNKDTILKADYIISDKPKSNFEVHPAFIRNNAVYNNIFLNAYDASIADNKLCSRGNVKPAGGFSRPSFRTFASNHNINWKVWTIQAHNLEILMVLIEYCSFDYRNSLSVGVAYDGGVSSAQNYPLDSNGTGKYENSATTSGPFTYRYRENVWGNRDKCLEYINIYNGHWYIGQDDNFTDGSSNNCLTVSAIACTSNGYITRFAYCENALWLFMPKVVSSNINDSICRDYYFYATGWRIIRVGDFMQQSTDVSGHTGFITFNTSPDYNNNGSLMGTGIVCYPPDQIMES